MSQMLQSAEMSREDQPYGFREAHGQLYEPVRWHRVCSRREYDEFAGQSEQVELDIVKYVADKNVPGAPTCLYGHVGPGCDLWQLHESFSEALDELVQVAAHSALVGEFIWEVALDERIPSENEGGRDITEDDLIVFYWPPGV